MIYDCAIVGGGPAGMSAAILLAEAGVRVVIMDRAARAGGQVYRSAADSVLPRPDTLGLDYTEGVALITAFESCAATHIAAADVWHIGEDGTILYSLNGTTRQLQAREILLCPGAIERPMPIPGWTLPGVMTAGAAQVMLKSDAVVAEKAIFAGSGPLLYLIVAQYLRLGVKVAGVIDTTPKANYLAALPGGAAALRSWPMLRKGLNLMSEISNSGVPVFKAATNLSVLGQTAATGLAFECNGAQEIQAETVFLHHGVIPHSNMSRSLCLEHLWNEAQQCWQVKTDSWGQSSIPHIAVAGDGAGIIGADGAQCAGRLAACNILYRLNVFSLNERDQRARKDQSKLIGMAPFRAFIDRLYQPVEELRLPKDPETLVCRCEEQRLKDLRAGYEAGARDPNALKSLTRCGMGPCQGRQCGPIVSSLLARWRQEPEEAVGYYRLRSPQRLLSLAEFSRFRYDDETGTEVEVPG